ncbi:MAG: ROK family protein [Polaromonas sp.]|nr:ROK family protein [Polaromonas sp.]
MACVDIGGTKISVQVVDARGALGQRVEPTLKEGAPDALARQVLRMVRASCQDAQVRLDDIGAVGVASCGPFVLNQGAVELASPNICGGLAGSGRGLPNDWTTAVLEGPLREAFGPARVRVENDGIAALQAERRWGALQGIDDCAYLTWSTGIGVGLCVDGRVLRGKNGNAGHAGHMFVSDNFDALCGCGNIGDVEALVAGNALPRRFPAFPDAASIFIAANAGDASAQAVIDDLCRVLGRMLYNLVVTLDLQRVSLGGSVFWHHRDLLLPRLQSQVRGRLPALTDGCSLVPAGLGEQVGDYAALALVA